MARKLTPTQEQILDGISNDVLAYDDIPQRERERLEKINNYESLWSDAERYLWDKAMNARFGRG